MVQDRRLIVRAGLFAAVVATVMAWPLATSDAADTSWVTPDGSPLFDITGLAPGDEGAGTVTVTNMESTSVTFSLSVVELRDDDNGCNEPEREAGDSTCGSGGGELQDDLQLTLTDAATETTIATGALADWANRPASDPIALDAGQARTYHIAYELPIGSSNLTQTDLVSFALAFTLTGADVASDPPTVVVVSATPMLPDTGGPAATLVVVAATLVAVGSGLLRVRSRRKVT